MKISINRITSGTVLGIIKYSDIANIAFTKFVGTICKFSIMKYPKTTQERAYIIFWCYDSNLDKIILDYVFNEESKTMSRVINTNHINDYDLASYSEKDLTKFFTWFKEFSRLYVL